MAIKTEYRVKIPFRWFDREFHVGEIVSSGYWDDFGGLYYGFFEHNPSIFEEVSDKQETDDDIEYLHEDAIEACMELGETISARSFKNRYCAFNEPDKQESTDSIKEILNRDIIDKCEQEITFYYQDKLNQLIKAVNKLNSNQVKVDHDK